MRRSLARKPPTLRRHTHIAEVARPPQVLKGHVRESTKSGALQSNLIHRPFQRQHPTSMRGCE